MKITFFPKYDESGASSRYRTYQYLKFFKENHIEIKVIPFFDESHIKNINQKKRKSIFKYLKYVVKRKAAVLFLKRNSLIVIEKELFPYFPPFFERFLKFKNIKFILDYDDAVIHNYDESTNPIIRKLLSNKIPIIQKKAAAVINGSYYLQNLSLKNNPNSFYIPTSLDIEKYKLKSYHSDEFIIGWIGSASTSQLILPFLNVIKQFCEHYHCNLHLIGFDKSLINLNEYKFIKLIEWQADTEIEEINKFSVGISPSTDSPFMRGKCAFKSIQYMACAKPVVTSPVGANADVVNHGITGFHANSEQDWYNYLEELYKNPELRQNMGKIGRKKVEEEFSIQVNYKKYIDLFNRINSQK